MKQITDIVQAACQVTGCSEADYHSKSRKNEAVVARMCVAYYQRTFQSLTFEAICPKDHATAMYYVGTVKKILSAKNDKNREQVMRFLSIMAAGQPIRGRADGRVLTITGQSIVAVYVDGWLTVMHLNGHISYIEAGEMNISQLVDLMQEG